MRSVLADTHAIVWALEGNPALSALAHELIADGEVDLVVSAVTPFEVAVKQAIGKLDTPGDLVAALDEAAVRWLPITAQHAWAVRQLPLAHPDPFDRLLIAQARVEGLPILTADEAFAAYDVETIW